MIAGDQPLCFPPELLVAVSSRDDGTMLDRTLDDRHDESVIERRKAFCQQVGCEYDSVVYQIIEYGDQQTYDVIVDVEHPDSGGVYADALYTETPNIGLFLPVADCVATVFYDPRRRALTLAHIGRHASVAKLMSKVVEYMQSKGSRPEDVIIWMAPSVAESDYRMDYFNHMNDVDWAQFAVQRTDGVYLNLSGFNSALAVRAGVPLANIHTSSVNTARDAHYFSHSQGDHSGRFAVVTMIQQD